MMWKRIRTVFIACLLFTLLSAPACGLAETASQADAQTTENDLSRIVTLGTAYATVRDADGTREVPTSSLVLGNVSDDFALAVIWAPKTGKATLRKSPSEKGTPLKNCKAGKIVAVLTLAGDYAKILYGGTEGYLRTDCLQFHAPYEGEAPRGVLSYKGRINGTTTVNVRLEGDRESRKIGEFATGTPIAVLAAGETWMEIEVKGLRGFVMSQYLSVETAEPTGEPTAETTDTPTAAPTDAPVPTGEPDADTGVG